MWDKLERIVGYPVDDSNVEQAIMEAQRPTIQKYYDEFVAARQSRNPQVLVRPGIGQVLGVR